MSNMFLDREDVAVLTGRKSRRLQIEALRQMGIPFYVNAIGTPMVTRVAVEGGKPADAPQKPVWTPRVLR